MPVDDIYIGLMEDDGEEAIVDIEGRGPRVARRWLHIRTSGQIAVRDSVRRSRGGHLED